MRRTQAPYAIAAALVFVLSISALAAALAAGGLLEERATSGPSPAPSASRAAPELSRAGRLAYWRTAPNGDNELWVSNIDGGQRHAIAKIDLMSRVSSTRWSPDGNAVAYLDRGQAVVVLRLDGGARHELGLPQLLIETNARIIDYGWSTDGGTIAATVRGAASGIPDTDTDVYVAPAAGGSWRAVTALRNAFLSQWISSFEILIHTQTGLIGVVGASDGSRLVPLTGMVATSPFLADDGRIYFLAGQVAPTIRDQTVPVVNAAQARVWSTTLDYDGDARPETTFTYDDVRLVGRWPNGRFVVHQGASTALALLSTNVPTIDTTLGVVDRMAFAPDRRSGIGLTATRIYRYDVSQPDRPVVLLSDVAQPDAWYPNPVTPARTSPPPAGQAQPAARYTFTLAGGLWTSDANGPRLLRQLGTDDRGLRRLSGVALPQWSPKGDRILYFDVPGNSFAGGVFLSARGAGSDGERVSDADASGPFPAWTPDGSVAYTRFIGYRDSAGFAPEAEVRVVSPTGGAPIATYKAREIAFGGAKTFLIDNGRPAFAPGALTRADHAILEVTPTGMRTIATAASVSAFERFGGATAIPWQLSMLGASADGTFLSVRESPAVGSIGFTFALLRVSDGTGVLGLSGSDVADVRWAPAGHLVGMTLLNIPVVRDAETGAIVASAGSGRFAGWAPDGKWFYVARDTGLYAIPLAGGEPVRVSALGVPVSTTTP